MAYIPDDNESNPRSQSKFTGPQKPQHSSPHTTPPAAGVPPREPAAEKTSFAAAASQPPRAVGKKSQRWRSSQRLSVIAIAVVVIIALGVTLFAWFSRRNGDNSHLSVPGAPSAPVTQPKDCPDVEVLVVPGTWETSRNDDPHNPHSHPFALLIPLAHKVQQAFPRSHAEVYTVPYVAEFKNPQRPHDVTYIASRKEGQERTLNRIDELSNHCPLTHFVLAGFSQGAVIAGDIANRIAQLKGPIQPEKLSLVGLIADGRREKSVGHDVGPTPLGSGAEVSLGGFSTSSHATGLDIPKMFNIDGIELRGPRPGGFGKIKDRVLELCAPHDMICDCPQFTLTNILPSLQKLGDILKHVHSKYKSTTYWSYKNQSATQWLTNKIIHTIKEMPEIPHEK